MKKQIYNFYQHRGIGHKTDSFSLFVIYPLKRDLAGIIEWCNVNMCYSYTQKTFGSLAPNVILAIFNKLNELNKSHENEKKQRIKERF